MCVPNCRVICHSYPSIIWFQCSTFSSIMQCVRLSFVEIFLVIPIPLPCYINNFQNTKSMVPVVKILLYTLVLHMEVLRNHLKEQVVTKMRLWNEDQVNNINFSMFKSERGEKRRQVIAFNSLLFPLWPSKRPMIFVTDAVLCWALLIAFVLILEQSWGVQESEYRNPRIRGWKLLC